MRYEIKQLAPGDAVCAPTHGERQATLAPILDDTENGVANRLEATRSPLSL